MIDALEQQQDDSEQRPEGRPADAEVEAAAKAREHLASMAEELRRLGRELQGAMPDRQPPSRLSPLPVSGGGLTRLLSGGPAGAGSTEAAMGLLRGADLPKDFFSDMELLLNRFTRVEAEEPPAPRAPAIQL